MIQQKNRFKKRKYLNKVYPMKILGKGVKGNFFGKIEDIICFVSDDKGLKLKFDEIINVKIINTTTKCLFAEVIDVGERE